MKKLLMILTLALILAAVPLMAQTGATNEQPASDASRNNTAATPPDGDQTTGEDPTVPPDGDGQGGDSIPTVGEPEAN